MPQFIQIRNDTMGEREARMIVLSRPGSANALSVQMLREVTEAVLDAEGKIICISSVGTTFSGGLDLRDMLRLKSAKSPLDHLIELYGALTEHKSPTVCLVEQKAVAGGVGLALCADAVVLSCNAWFSLPPASIYRPLAEVLFPVVAKRRGITHDEFDRWYGNNISAGELHQNGYVDAVVHRELGQPVTAKLKEAAALVLSEKGLLRKTDIEDRLGQDVRTEMATLELDAADISTTYEFREEAQNALHSKRPSRRRDRGAVFVVHGRDMATRSIMFEFLKSIGLKPLEWETVVKATGSGTPFIGQVVSIGLDMAQAIVVLITGDDEARLLKCYHQPADPGCELELTPQARQNVTLEVGMALGKYEGRTILVEKAPIRSMSNLLGRHVVRLDEDGAWKKAVIQRLRSAGCSVCDH